MRNDTIQGRELTDPAAYEANVKLAHEVADVLRKNIVQARRVDGTSGNPDDEVWSASHTFLPLFHPLTLSHRASNHERN